MILSRLFIRILPAIFVLTLPSATLAQQNSDCPKKLGTVGNDRVANVVTKIMIDVYDRLGCRVQIVTLPGRRGYVAFNEGQIDGEIFRFPIATKNYSRPYVQSTFPVIETSNSLWAAPGSKLYSDAPVGFMIGLAWQEHYLAENPTIAASGLRDVDDIISHYNNGNIDRFLAEDETVRIAIRNGTFPAEREPIQLEVLKVGTLYHFLGAEFQPFMNRLSDYITQHDPFGDKSTM